MNTIKRNLIKIFTLLYLLITSNLIASDWKVMKLVSDESNPQDSIQLNLKEGWNLISVPSQFRLNHPSVSAIFYWLNNSYHKKTENILFPTRGYWVFSSENFSVHEAIDPKDYLVHHIVQGWNLVGSSPNEYVSSMLNHYDFQTFEFSNSSYQQVQSMEHGKGYWLFADEWKQTMATIDIDNISFNLSENSVSLEIIDTSILQADTLLFSIYDTEDNIDMLASGYFESGSHFNDDFPPSAFHLLKREISGPPEHDIKLATSKVSINLNKTTQFRAGKTYMVQVTPMRNSKTGQPVVKYVKPETPQIHIDQSSYDWQTGALTTGTKVEYAAYKMTKSGKILKTYHPMGTYDEDGEVILDKEIFEEIWQTKLAGNKIIIMTRAVDSNKKPLTPWKTVSSESLTINKSAYHFVYIDLLKGKDSQLYPTKCVNVNEAPFPGYNNPIFHLLQPNSYPELENTYVIFFECDSEILICETSTLTLEIRKQLTGENYVESDRLLTEAEFSKNNFELFKILNKKSIVSLQLLTTEEFKKRFDPKDYEGQEPYIPLY